ADPHEYEASPATAKIVADSKLVIVNGIGYDDFMEKLLGASTKPDRVVIKVQEIIGAKDDVNVHVWYNPATMPKIADAATAALADVAAERDLITGHKVKALLYNSQVTSPLTEQIRELAVSNNVPVVAVAETIPPAFGTFQEWQVAQLDDLEKALAK